MVEKLNDTELSEALENCAKEPIHIPGAVQGHGALVAFDTQFQQVLACSENIENFLGCNPEQLFGKSAADCFADNLMTAMQRAANRLDPATPTASFEYSFEQADIDVFCTLFKIRQQQSQQLLILEIEPLYVKLASDFTSTVRQQFSRVQAAKTEQQTLQQLVKSAAAISNFERVLVYKFDSEWNGEVVAEYLRESDISSFMGQHFPSSDIPPQVRDMYRVNAARKIASTSMPAAQLVQNPDIEALEPLDLSLGMLRAVSPIHAVYMENMGICRSLSIAIFDEKKLWGILSCHGLRPAQTNPYQRHALHSLVMMASQRLMLQRQYQALQFFDKVEQSRKALLDPDKDIMAPEQLLKSQGKRWLKLFQIELVVLVHGNEISQVGEKLPLSTLVELAEWLRKKHWITGLYSSRELGASDCSMLLKDTDFRGLLAVSMPYEKELNGWLLMFRREAVEVKTWAGQPEKTERQQFKGRTVLSPRRSFVGWQEQLQGRSIEWTDDEKQAAKTLAEDLAIGASAYQIEQLNSQLQQANDRLEHLVHTDALTQLWNRYHMEQALDEELSRAQRHGHPLSVIIFDIDNFKQINDDYGHDVGDEVLKGISKALDSLMRKSDALGRWGGEEFLVIAPEVELDNAAELAERLRQVMADIEFDKAGVVTASFGVAELDQADTRSDLVRRADKALYRAKNEGRNRVYSE
ncbi:sensor domain-containing diguanylate cyclase [Idiomarina sp.]|uniref:sensor domain-containing diguanylate cyclase n=1 Tax=Idiomarina sp. TaxID=1874361 RepID=UPI0025B9FB24|nr:sensor domain-containing diguanylate cyclase [Idiomarina sp.]